MINFEIRNYDLIRVENSAGIHGITLGLQHHKQKYQVTFQESRWNNVKIDIEGLFSPHSKPRVLSVPIQSLFGMEEGDGTSAETNRSPTI